MYLCSKVLLSLPASFDGGPEFAVGGKATPKIDVNTVLVFMELQWMF